jgi:hypothetical protein
MGARASASLGCGLLLAVVALPPLEAPGAGPAAGPKTPEHWAFQRPGRPAVPASRGAAPARNPVDAFLLARLEAKGLTYASEADRVTLLRRAYLDLWGLPPTPEAVDAFLADGRPDRFERLVDRLLASPHFGERWARHWLDVVGYADTVGFDIDATLIIQSEGKWRYRDYVIAALNKDMPFDQFVREQIAGDEMVDWRRARTFTREIRDKLVATGFLRNARDESHEPESNIPLIYYGVLHNTLDILGNSLLGLTLNCARCHDHKFDPISQKEYYQLMAFLTPAYNPKDWRPVYPWKAGVKDRTLPDVSPAEQAEIERHNREIDRQSEACKRRLAKLRRPHEARLQEAKFAGLPEPIRADTREALRTSPGKRNAIQKYLAGKLEKSLAVSAAEVAAAMSSEERAAAALLEKQLAGLSARRRSWGKIQALFDVGPPPATHLLRRGDHNSPRAEVQPGFIKVLTDGDRPVAIPAQAPPGSSGRRLALAQWLTQPKSRAAGLLARVMVNRLWQHLFGEGLVPTPENFGLSGTPPTHPELLEWLASEFAERGWRIKPMIKLMMTSAAYRQASRVAKNPRAEKADPANALLWKMRLRRLEAEAIRDGMLSASGQLNTAAGGAPVPIKSQFDGMVVINAKELPTPEARNRRSIYLVSRRAYNLSLLSVFDRPLVAVNCARRDASALPLQSLTMMNDAFVTEQAGHLARRVLRAAAGAKDRHVRLAFRHVLARTPSAVEEEVCARLLRDQASLFAAAKMSDADAEERALAQLCHVLFNTSEFLYAE